MEWDFDRNAVQKADDPRTGHQLGSKAVLVSFGPPVKKPDSKFIVCGFIQNLSMNQQKQVQELFEVGSGRRYMADGPTRNMLNISRALFSGPSLLKVLGTGMTNSSMDEGGDNEYMKANQDLFREGSRKAAATDFNDAFWMNLGSNIFQNPLGVLLEYKSFGGDGEGRTFGSVFLENCKATSHSIQMNAGQWLLNENMQFRFESVKPVDTTSISVNDYYAQVNENDDGVMNQAHNTDIKYNLSDFEHNA